MPEPARIVVRRRIDWIDTDATGIYHWTTTFRLCEAAEADLHDRLGIRQRTFGLTPRVHIEADFHRALRFYELVDLELRVEQVGSTSVRYGFTMRSGDGLAAVGQVVTVFVSEPGGTPTPWPDGIRRALLEGGDQGRAGEGVRPEPG